MIMFIHFFCLCPLSLAIKLNFNISKVVYCFSKIQLVGQKNIDTKHVSPVKTIILVFKAGAFRY